MIFESHAHYHDNKFKGEVDEVVTKMRDANVTNIINVACSVDEFQTVLDYTNKYPEFYGAIGVHPHLAGDLSDDDMDLIRKFLQEDKIIALGEIGLDYYYDTYPRDLQKKWFIEQLKIAKKFDIPVIIHSRDACKDTMDIVKQYGHGKGVVHCFSGSIETAKQYISMGYKIGVGGVVTFKNAKLPDVVKTIGIKNILIETDAPYISPVPVRGTRNDSSNLVYIVDKIAEILGLTSEEVMHITEQNGKQLFNIN